MEQKYAQIPIELFAEILSYLHYASKDMYIDAEIWKELIEKITDQIKESLKEGT